MKTFEEFQRSLVVFPFDQTPSRLKDNGQDEGESQLCYDDESSVIFQSGLNYRLHIGNEEWLSPDLLNLEQILYCDWYLREVAA